MQIFEEKLFREIQAESLAHVCKTCYDETIISAAASGAKGVIRMNKVLKPEEKSMGKNRRALQGQRLYFSGQRNLRRPRQHVGLRPARRKAEK